MVLYILTFTFLDSRREDKKKDPGPNDSKHSILYSSQNIILMIESKNMRMSRSSG
jgi:hypothetical protein